MATFSLRLSSIGSEHESVVRMDRVHPQVETTQTDRTDWAGWGHAYFLIDGADIHLSGLPVHFRELADLLNRAASQLDRFEEKRLDYIEGERLAGEEELTPADAS